MHYPTDSRTVVSVYNSKLTKTTIAAKSLASLQETINQPNLTEIFELEQHFHYRKHILLELARA
jgi:hypothetical protein